MLGKGRKDMRFARRYSVQRGTCRVLDTFRSVSKVQTRSFELLIGLLKGSYLHEISRGARIQQYQSEIALKRNEE